MDTSVVVVGAGPSGLAMSHQLSGAGVDHVVLERGAVANSWRTERWDSLRLLTPNWMAALPGAPYDGGDPDGYMTAAETAAALDAYCASFDPPLYSGVEVKKVCRVGDRFEVQTSYGAWRCDAVVVATGGSSEPRVPAFAAEFPGAVQQLTALTYRRPAQVDDGGGVLVVGASASGVQIADELRRAGREVTIAVGDHIRLPRSYRGWDIYRWLERIGQLDERWDEVEDLQRARRHASVQVVGSDDGREVDLPALQARGVRLTGRLMAVCGTTALCSGGLGGVVANADLKQARLLRRIDEWVDSHHLDGLVGPAVTPSPTVLGSVPTRVDLARLAAVIWATGFRPVDTWLDSSALDRHGRVEHDGGVAALPGLYVLGRPFLRRRRSNLLAGLGLDASELASHLAVYLGAVARRRTLTWH